MLLVHPCPAYTTYLDWPVAAVEVGTPGGYSAGLWQMPERKGHSTHESDKGSVALPSENSQRTLAVLERYWGPQGGPAFSVLTATFQILNGHGSEEI